MNLCWNKLQSPKNPPRKSLFCYWIVTQPVISRAIVGLILLAFISEIKYRVYLSKWIWTYISEYYMSWRNFSQVQSTDFSSKD